MRIGKAIILTAALSASAVANAAPETYNQASLKIPLPGDSILENLRPGHPRLIATKERISDLKKQVSEDKQVKDWGEKIKARADSIVSQPPAEHKLIGPRLLHQSRLALDRVYILALSYHLFEKPEHLQRLEKELLTVCDFPDWNPSHFLDTAEMTHAVAIGYDWLYDKWSPETREKLKNSIIKLGLEPGLKAYDQEGKGPRFWTRTKNNWNQVCAGGLALGALAIADENKDLSVRLLNHIRTNLDYAMPEFAPDGGWVEGPGYWNYTTVYCFYLFAGLETALGTSWGYKDTPGFKDTGYFIPAMKGPTGHFFNWGDGGSGLGTTPQLFWMADFFDNSFYAWLARQQMSSSPGVPGIFYYSDKGKSPAEINLKKDWWFKGIDVASMRESWDNPNASFVAFKGGDNTAPHSNLDLGSFVFDSLGERWAIELGSDDYNLPGYFNHKKRLPYYRINSFGQNVLILNNGNQNPNAKAKITEQVSNDSSASTSIDLSEAYNESGTSVTRTFSLLNDRKDLTIQDSIKADKSLEYAWQFHTKAEIVITSNPRSAILKQNNKLLHVNILSPKDATITTATARQEPPQNPNDGISKLIIKGTLPKGETQLKINFAQ